MLLLAGLELTTNDLKKPTESKKTNQCQLAYFTGFVGKPIGQK